MNRNPSNLGANFSEDDDPCDAESSLLFRSQSSQNSTQKINKIQKKKKKQNSRYEQIYFQIWQKIKLTEKEIERKNTSNYLSGNFTDGNQIKTKIVRERERERD